MPHYNPKLNYIYIDGHLHIEFKTLHYVFLLQSGLQVMDFSYITSTIWSYVTWPLSFVSQPIKQPILGAVFGW